MSFLIGVAVVAVSIKLFLRLLLFALQGKRRTGKRGIIGKIIYLIRRRIHASLDEMINRQKENLAVRQGHKTNVIKLSNYKRKVN